MKNLLCKMFGHKTPPSYEYGQIIKEETDGIGRVHGTVTVECQRCEKSFKLIKVHIPMMSKN